MAIRQVETLPIKKKKLEFNFLRENLSKKLISEPPGAGIDN